MRHCLLPGRPGRTLSALALVLLVAAARCYPQTPPAYDSAYVDAAGQLHIRTTGNTDVLAPRDTDQVGFDQPAVSPDHRAVGWLALYPNCCTSYPIPLTLLLLTPSGLRTIAGTGLPIWRWRFDSTGALVAIYQDVVHGGVGGHYELRTVTKADLVAQYDPIDSLPAPSWVTGLAGGH